MNNRLFIMKGLGHFLHGVQFKSAIDLRISRKFTLTLTFSHVTRLSTVFILSIFLCGSICNAQIKSDPKEAFQSACENNLPVLIVFSGSDWCAPCMRFEKQVLSQDAFNRFIADKVVVYEADFPQRKKLEKKTQQSNEALAEAYNPKGVFPHFVLVGPDRSVITTLIYEDESVEAFIKKISRHLEDEQAKNVQAAE